MGSAWYDGYGSDRLVQIERLAKQVRDAFPNSVFFASRLMFEHEHWWNRWLHHHTPLAMQRILNEHGMELVILPVLLSESCGTPHAAHSEAGQASAWPASDRRGGRLYGPVRSARRHSPAGSTVTAASSMSTS
jgi:hypothetical protein